VEYYYKSLFHCRQYCRHIGGHSSPGNKGGKRRPGKCGNTGENEGLEYGRRD